MTKKQRAKAGTATGARSNKEGPPGFDAAQHTPRIDLGVPVSPVPLRSYQLDWLKDPARLKCLVKARRVGGTFAVGLDIACSAVGFRFEQDGSFSYDSSRGVDQFVIGPAKRQSKIMLKEAAKHLDVLCYIIGADVVDSVGIEKIKLKNGRAIEAIPANPDTIRGATGDITFEECQSIPHPKEVWAAAKSVADPTNARPGGYKVRANGTALSDDNLLYSIARTDFGQDFSQHLVDIYQAQAAGFPADLERLRREAGDPDTFAAEYECHFFAASSRYISAALYDACLYDEGELPTVPHRTLFCGMDVGKRKDGDPSVIVGVERHDDDSLWHTQTEDRRGEEWDDQEAWVTAKLSGHGGGAMASAIGIDGTGIGDQFASRLVNAHGASRVKPYWFTVPLKAQLMTGLKLAMGRRRLHLRADDTDLRRDVLSIKREHRQSGNVVYSAERTKEGHADRAWALAMAIDIACEGVGVGDYGVDTYETRGTYNEMTRIL